MMLVTVDPVSETAGILSIPRDLWVEIPGFEHNRINTAYSLGESFDYPADGQHPGGGPGLAMRTVENLLGVQIQYYAVIEFLAFQNAINEIGGIDVLVLEPMRMAIIGRYSMDLEAKPYHFDARRRSPTHAPEARAEGTSTAPGGSSR
jgi:LCP family protein required for cell wall assembly